MHVLRRCAPLETIYTPDAVAARSVAALSLVAWFPALATETS
jgi:hypothetical protein